MSSTTPAGWFPDPEDPQQQRYWDGSAWTEHRSPRTDQTAGYQQGYGQRAPQGYGQGYPQGYPPPYGQGYPPGPQPQAPGAVVALVLGILSLVSCGLVTGIPAMIVGRRAIRAADASGDQLGGKGLAQAGFWTGLVGTVVTGLALLVVILVFVFGSSIRTS